MKILSLFNKSAGAKKYLFNTIWLFAEQGQRLIFAFVIGIFVVRYLGPTDYGKISYAQGFVGLFAFLSQMGLSNIVVRDLVRKRFGENELLGAAWMLQCVGGILNVLFVGVGLLFINSSAEVKTLAVIISLAEILKSSRVIKFSYMADVKTKNLAKVSLIQGILISGIKIILIALQADVVWFGMAIFFDALVGAVGLVYIYQQDKGKVFDWTIHKEIVKALLKDSWPMIFYGMALQIQAKIDQVMLGNMVGEAEVGNYSVAFKIIEIFVIIPQILVKSLAPSITKAKEAGEELYHKRLLNLYRLLFLVFLVYGGAVYLSAERLIVFLYGEEFRAAGILLSLFAIRLFFNCMGIAKATFITNENLFQHGMKAAISGAVVNVLANLYLIPLYQSRGAIVATIISFTTFVFVIDLSNAKARENLKLMLKGIGTFYLVKKV